jgi:general secretion pathway protein A
LVYDGALKAQVKHFQRAHGLQPNGLAGPRTQILLNAIVPSPGAPSLKASQKKQG